MTGKALKVPAVRAAAAPAKDAKRSWLDRLAGMAQLNEAQQKAAAAPRATSVDWSSADKKEPETTL